MATAIERRIEAARLDEEQIIARARELTAGAKLHFDEREMVNALSAFMDYKRISQRFWGDTRDYLRVTSVYTQFGTPTCSECNKGCYSLREYATHMMSRQHFIDSYRTSLAAVNEVRAHLHAHPMSPKLWSGSLFEASRKYRFIGLPRAS